MKLTSSVTLTERERATLERILGSFTGRIGQVKVFGSRATGKARPASDLDLIVYPPFNDRDRFDLMNAFEESDLPICVDILAADQLDPAFRQAVESHALPLFVEDADVA